MGQRDILWDNENMLEKSISEISFPQHSSQALPLLSLTSSLLPSHKVSYPCSKGLGMYASHPSIHCNTAAA